MNKTLLHVGCGYKTAQQLPFLFQQGWKELRLDLDPKTKPDIIGSMIDLQLDAQSIDAIYSSHNLEHLYAHEVGQALKEFTRVLKHHGFLVITLPDLQSIAQLVVDDKLMETAYESGMGAISAIDMIFGHRDSIAANNTLMAHKTGFTKTSLAAALERVGFEEVRVMRGSHFDLWAIACIEKQGERFWNLMDKTIVVK